MNLHQGLKRGVESLRLKKTVTRKNIAIDEDLKDSFPFLLLGSIYTRSQSQEGMSPKES